MPKKLVCHCLLIETTEGLVLIDTGFGTEEMTHIGDLNWQSFVFMAQPVFEIEETALFQIKKLGFKPEEVRHILVTHLDHDHAGGLKDFPKAKVHIYEPELQQALHPVTTNDKARFVPRQWSHRPKWVRYPTAGEKWFGFEAVKNLEGLPPEILMVPLVGHTLGHCGIAVDTPNGWLLHAGDAYYYRGEIDYQKPHAPKGITMLANLTATDKLLWAYNQQRLRELAHNHSDNLHVFCSHDESEFNYCCHA
jgi:glyoxylase-like metal-dependent hydrolase (beta-lactamase superfamily II)